MALIEWTEEMSVKIPSIDKQHKVLIGLINKLDDAVKQNKGNQVLDGIIKELVRYTQAHFIYEEAMFTANGYPQSDSHKKAHGKLFQKVEKFKNVANEGRPEIYDELLEFLNYWLYHHILKEDMAYSQHLVEKGVEQETVHG